MKFDIKNKAIRLFTALLLIGNAVSGQRAQQYVSNSVGKSANGCFPADLNINITQGTDAMGCFYDVEYKPIWALAAGGFCDINQAPHGFYVEFTGGTTIAANPTRTGAWLTGATQTPASPTGNFVYWNRQPSGVCPTPTSAIPSGQLQKVRIRVNPGSGPVTVSVRTLIGQSWPNTWAPPIPSAPGGWLPPNQPYSNVWDCGTSKVFNPLPVNYNIGNNTSVCSGTFMTLNVSPTPPAGSTVTWYRSGNGAVCPPLIYPLDANGWTMAQLSGNAFNTNQLNHTECFVAVVKQGCWSYTSNVRTITVCPGAPSALITSLPTNGNPALQTINGVNHACLQWQGLLKLTPATFPCPTTITWEKKYAGTTVWTPIAGSANQTQINTQPLYLLSSLACNLGYDFRARLTNACGISYVSFSIIIDNVANGGGIKTQTTNFYDVGTGTNVAPVLCYNTGTRLVHTTTCGKLKGWEYRDEITPCSNNYPATWTPVPGSAGTSTWFTNNLVKSRQYRVLVENGGCNNDPPLPNQGTYSQIFTVKVKPELTATITTTSNLMCMSPVITAATSYGAPCNYPIASYQWYLNGVAIPGSTGSAIHPTTPGNYSVEISDGACKTKATSNVITICSAKLVVTGTCCVCPGETVAVGASLVYDPVNCGPAPTYLWSNGATTASISVTQPGTYSVTVHLGTCVLTGSTTVGPCH